MNRQVIVTHIVIAVTEVFQELDWVFISLFSFGLNCIFELFNCFLELAHLVVALRYSIENARVFAIDIQVKCSFEMLLRFFRFVVVQFGHTEIEVSRRVCFIELNGSLEVSYCLPVVAHVLVNQTSLDVHCLVFRELLLHLGKLIKCFVETQCSAIHKTQVEH